MNVNQIHQAFLKELLHLLEDAGVRPSQLFAEFSQRRIAPSPDAEAIKNLVLIETAVELSGDPSLMIRVGQRLGITGYGSFGFALMSCANLRDATRLMLRYGQILFRPGWEAHEHGRGLFLRAQISEGTALQQQLATELVFSNLITIGRALYGSAVERFEGVEVQLRHSSPSHSAWHRLASNIPVTFDCEHSQVFLPAQALDIPVRTANISEHIVFQQQCEEMLRGLDAVEKTTVEVRHLLVQSAGDFLDIDQVAERMNISARTLRRRLDDESTSFRSILDEIRDLLAREYLAKTELTVADIALLLGYAEPPSFRRAFLRWNGVTPIEYRRQHMAESVSQGSAV